MSVLTDLSGPTPLADGLDCALASGQEADLARLAGLEAANRRDRLLTLLAVYDVHTAPIESLGPAVRWQHHPSLAAVRATAEAAWLRELDQVGPAPDLPSAPLAALRTTAARNRLPAVYGWLAKHADLEQVIRFVSWEGGPDAGFDDLVATCQLGLSGPAKMELATNYWDEMGEGSPGAVHTTLYEELTAALDTQPVPRRCQPESALARTALLGLLATNRWLQPELLGALGLIELEAGPRCRLVAAALERVGAPAAALPFYRVHADVDPRHGKDWLENAIAPSIEAHPDWAPRILRGASWREETNNTFLADVHRVVTGSADSC